MVNSTKITIIKRPLRSTTIKHPSKLKLFLLPLVPPRQSTKHQKIPSILTLISTKRKELSLFLKFPGKSPHWLHKIWINLLRIISRSPANSEILPEEEIQSLTSINLYPTSSKRNSRWPVWMSKKMVNILQGRIIGNWDISKKDIIISWREQKKHYFRMKMED